MTAKRSAVIVDMDGTLCGWDGSVLTGGMVWVEGQHDAGHAIIILTYRDRQSWFMDTHLWLRRNLTVPFVGPVCRQPGDNRSAPAFKRAAFHKLSRQFNIVAAIDDEPEVLAMWSTLGIEAIPAAGSAVGAAHRIEHENGATGDAFSG